MRRHMTLFTLMILLVSARALAAPALPHQVALTQTDGTSVAATAHGDEYQHWMESSDSGHTIVRNPATGNWEYAFPAADGTLRPANIKVVPNAQNAPFFIETGLKPPRDAAAEQQRQNALKRQLDLRSQQGGSFLQGGALPTETLRSGSSTTLSGAASGPGWAASSVSGTRKMLLILVNFNNRALVTTPLEWGQAVFSTNPGDKSVANYYQENSLGNLTITPAAHTHPTGVPGVVPVTINLPHEFNGTPEPTWVQAALDQAANDVDFNALDENGDGIIDTTEAVVYFVLAGYEQSGTTKPPYAWAHTYFSSSYLYAGGKRIAVWARSGELNSWDVRHPIGVIAHELGHQMVGFPDLYDTSNSNAGLGAYSLMSIGSWGADFGEAQGTTPVGLDAWCREFAGWTTPVVPDGNGVVTLDGTKSADNTLKLVNPLYSSSEYFLVENRQPQGWDLGLTLFLGGGWDGGLLIEHVDNAMGTNRRGASAHQGVMVMQANTSPCNMLGSSSCYGNQDFFFYAGNNNSFNTSTAPAAKYYNGTSTFRGLDNISMVGRTMTAYYSVGGAAPTGSIKVNGGALYTKTPAVSLTLSAFVPSPSVVKEMCFTNDGSTWSAWEPFKSSRSWTLDAGDDSVRTVTVRYRDAGGNESVPYSASITLDTVAPSAIILIQGSLGETTKATAITFAAGNDDAVSYKSKLDAGLWSKEMPVTMFTTYTNIAKGSHILYVVAKDAAGNWQDAGSPTTVTWTVDATLPVTTAIPAGGNYNDPQTVVLTATRSATVYYTTNGTTPTTASTVYSDPIAISSKTVLKYFAVDSLGNTEAVKTQTYQFPSTATVSGVAAVTRLSTATLTVGGSGVVSYRYQLDGGAQSGELSVTTRIALSGLAAGEHSVSVVGKNNLGLWQQTPTTVTWTVEPSLPVTTASLADGVYPPGQTVTLAADKGGKIYFTVNGSTPNVKSSVYALPLNINQSTTLKYFAVDPLGNTEAINTKIYNITTVTGAPVMTKSTSALLTVGGSGIVSYTYSADGAGPSSETPVSVRISLTGLADGVHTVSVLGKRADGTWQQAPTQVSWTVSHTPVVTEASPAGGSYAGTQTVTLSSSGPATIYYTMNGSAPSTSAIRYQTPIVIATTTTLRFFSMDPAGNAEVAKTEYYTVQPTAVVTGVPLLTKQTSATLAVTGAGVVSYRYQLDGGSQSAEFPVSAKITLSALDAGSHTVSVAGKDKQGLWQDTPTTLTWTVQPVVPVTTASLPDGIYPPGQSVTLTSADGARIYYTVNGSTPTTRSILYTAPISINASTTLRYFALDSAGNVEPVKSRIYTVTNLFAVPASLTRSAGATVSVGGSGVASYVYAVDGGGLSAQQALSQKIALNLSDGEHTLAVYGKKGDGTWQQDPTLATWTVDTHAPFTTATPAGGTYSGAQTVTLSAEDGAVIYYTTDGKVPSGKSAKYTGPITIASSTTLKYFAVDAIGNAETVKTQIYALPPTATISGVSDTMAAGMPVAFVVGGDYVRGFKYRLDGAAWSVEVAIPSQRTLSGLSSGTHQLQVIGKDAAGVWQDAASPTTVVWNVQ